MHLQLEFAARVHNTPSRVTGAGQALRSYLDLGTQRVVASKRAGAHHSPFFPCDHMLTLFFAFVGGIGGTAAARWIAHAVGAVAQPCGTSSPQHRRPVALLGGLGIAAGLGMALIAAPGTAPSRGVMAGSALMLAVGTLDDFVRLRPLTKLAGQLVAGAVPVAMGVIGHFSGYHLLDVALSLALFVTSVNAANLTDVCDGLVGGLMVIAAGFVASLQGAGIFPAAAAAASAGFLIFNRPPATIFLGDGGVHLLGFVVAAAGVSAWNVEPAARTGVAFVFIYGVFLFELLFLIVVRLQNGRPVWLASPDHFSLRMQAGTFSHWQTVLVSWAAGVLCGCAGIAVTALRWQWGAVVCGGVLTAAWLCARKLSTWEVRRPLVADTSANRNPVQARLGTGY